MNPTLMAFTSDMRKCMKTKPTIDFEKVANEKAVIFCYNQSGQKNTT